jgi:hypothetical protein
MNHPRFLRHSSPAGFRSSVFTDTVKLTGTRLGLKHTCHPRPESSAPVMVTVAGRGSYASGVASNVTLRRRKAM